MRAAWPALEAGYESIATTCGDAAAPPASQTQPFGADRRPARRGRAEKRQRAALRRRLFAGGNIVLKLAGGGPAWRGIVWRSLLSLSAIGQPVGAGHREPRNILYAAVSWRNSGARAAAQPYGARICSASSWRRFTRSTISTISIRPDFFAGSADSIIGRSPRTNFWSRSRPHVSQAKDDPMVPFTNVRPPALKRNPACV
jgi:hypothetical protein